MLFRSTVDPGAPLGAQTLHLQLLLAEVPVAYLSVPLRVERSNMATALAVPVVDTPRLLPRHLWVCHSADDTPLMSERLLALRRWAPTLSLHVDSVHAAPAERERALAATDALLICWSRACVTDPEVIRQLGLVWQRLGPEAVLPMPLDDPEAVWPPHEFAESPWLERYRMAWAALAPAVSPPGTDEAETEAGAPTRW